MKLKQSPQLNRGYGIGYVNKNSCFSRKLSFLVSLQDSVFIRENTVKTLFSHVLCSLFFMHLTMNYFRKKLNHSCLAGLYTEPGVRRF